MTNFRDLLRYAARKASEECRASARKMSNESKDEVGEYESTYKAALYYNLRRSSSGFGPDRLTLEYPLRLLKRGWRGNVDFAYCPDGIWGTSNLGMEITFVEVKTIWQKLSRTGGKGLTKWYDDNIRADVGKLAKIRGLRPNADLLLLLPYIGADRAKIILQDIQRPTLEQARLKGISLQPA